MQDVVVNQKNIFLVFIAFVLMAFVIRATGHCPACLECLVAAIIKL